MSTTVSLINMKGGVGKTTLSVNLGAIAAEEGYKTLVVDLDPQANASLYLMGYDPYIRFREGNNPCIVDIFQQLSSMMMTGQMTTLTAADIILPIRQWWARDNLYLLPSRLELSWTLREPAGKEHLLSRFLAKEASDFDLILIDCPPTESVFTTAAYLASTHVLVPVVPDYLSTTGLPLLTRSIDVFQAQFDSHSLEIAWVVFVSAMEEFREHERAKKFVLDTAVGKNWYVFENEISFSRSYVTAPRAGTPITHRDHARYDVRDEARAFAREFLGRIGL